MAVVAAAQYPERAPGWTRRHTLAVLSILAAIVGVGVVLPWAAGPSGNYQHARLFAWLVTAGLFMAVALVVGHGLTGLTRGVFVDERQRLSLSRVQMFLWTVLVLSAYLSAALANIGLDTGNPLEIGVPESLWLAMGLSTTSLVAAPLVLHTTRGKRVAVNQTAAQSSWTDLVSGEEQGFVDGVDLAKLQLMLFTIVLVVAYAVGVGHAFARDGETIGALPRLNDAFVIMLGISHAGYLAKKSVPKPRPPTRRSSTAANR